MREEKLQKLCFLFLQCTVEDLGPLILSGSKCYWGGNEILQVEALEDGITSYENRGLEAYSQKSGETVALLFFFFF